MSRTEINSTPPVRPMIQQQDLSDGHGNSTKTTENLRVLLPIPAYLNKPLGKRV
jgi:hypothetical protein